MDTKAPHDAHERATRQLSHSPSSFGREIHQFESGAILDRGLKTRSCPNVKRRPVVTSTSWFRLPTTGFVRYIPVKLDCQPSQLFSFRTMEESKVTRYCPGLVKFGNTISRSVTDVLAENLWLISSPTSNSPEFLSLWSEKDSRSNVPPEKTSSIAVLFSARRNPRPPPATDRRSRCCNWSESNVT